ncbi:MAG: Fe-S-containing hydro-lyase [bacterium JZ-2024 1]
MNKKEEKVLSAPLTEEAILQLHAGDSVRLSGVIYTARDAAHKRLVQTIEEGKEPPFPLEGQVIYYVGPTPAPPGKPIGSAGPTTSYRMDVYVPLLLQKGLKGMIGKGARSDLVKEALKQYKAVYFGAVGGAGALLARYILSASVVAYEDLGAEAIHRLEVQDFPLVVINDIYGNDLYLQGKALYRKSFSSPPHP